MAEQTQTTELASKPSTNTGGGYFQILETL